MFVVFGSFASLFFGVANLFMICHPIYASAYYLRSQGRCPNPTLNVLEAFGFATLSSFYAVQIGFICLTSIIIELLGVEMMLYYLNLTT